MSEDRRGCVGTSACVCVCVCVYQLAVEERQEKAQLLSLVQERNINDIQYQYVLKNQYLTT